MLDRKLLLQRHVSSRLSAAVQSGLNCGSDYWINRSLPNCSQKHSESTPEKIFWFDVTKIELFGLTAKCFGEEQVLFITWVIPCLMWNVSMAASSHEEPWWLLNIEGDNEQSVNNIGTGKDSHFSTTKISVTAKSLNVLEWRSQMLDFIKKRDLRITVHSILTEFWHGTVRKKGRHCL